MNPRLLAYLQLVRIPNVFTAISNIAMGFVYVQSSFQPVAKFALLAAASSLLYSAGMVLNDVFDFAIDKTERPERPLPSGRIALGWATKLGFGLLAAGVLLAGLCGLVPAIIALALAVAIYLYDGVVKRTPLAPLLMGCCRTLNILLGMSVAGIAGPTAFSADQWLVAGGIGVYVMGITWFARAEAKTSDKGQLSFAFGVMGLGIAMLAAFPWFTQRGLMLRGELIWPTLLVLLMISVTRRCVTAIIDPIAGNVQTAVKHCIMTLIILDAAVILAIAGPLFAIPVLALIVPSLLLGKWIYST